MLRLVTRNDTKVSRLQRFDVPMVSRSLTRVPTKSGLPIPVVVVDRGHERAVAAREHPRLVRVTHWLNTVFFTVMTMSGLQIFAAFPSFGPKIPQSDIVSVPAVVGLGGWLGGALQWHYTFAWMFMLTGVVYLGYLVGSGHWRRVVVQRQELKGLWPMVRHYLLFSEKPEPREPYNPLQKLAYTTSIVLGMMAVISGVLLARPVLFGAVVTALGGFQAVRLYHFATMIGLLGFVAGHLVMVAAHGWQNFASMWTGWKKDPPYLGEQ
jgi:thiosulfate reductase cytochrome b subunit